MGLSIKLTPVMTAFCNFLWHEVKFIWPIADIIMVFFLNFLYDAISCSYTILICFY